MVGARRSCPLPDVAIEQARSRRHGRARAHPPSPSLQPDPGCAPPARRADSAARGTALPLAPTPTGMLTPLDLGPLYCREVSLVPSSSCGPPDTRRAYELLRTGRVRVDGLVTHRFPLENVQEAFDMARRGGPVLK